SRLRREGLRDRRQPRHRARSDQAGSHQESPRRQSHGAPADRLDAARGGAREHRLLRPRGVAGPPPHLGGRGLGQSLVAGAVARVDGGAARRQCGGGGRMSERTIAVWQGKVRLRVLSKGSGPALVYFHGPWGLTWDPFLDMLARDFTVHAPEHPGTTPGAPDDIYQLDGLWDLVLCYDELLDALGLEQAVLVGHSFGAMVACEVAASTPRRARQLVLIDPIGFWRDADPVVNWMALEPAEMRRRLFRDPGGEAAGRLF